MFFLFHIGLLYGQSFEFENYEPLWSHNSVVEEFQDDILAFQPLKPLVQNNAIYFTQNIQKFFFDGHITEKLDLIDGKLYWKYYYLQKENGNREYAQRPFIDTDSTIKMMIFRERSEGEAGLVWGKAVMSQITLNSDTGEKIDSIVTDKSDTLNQTLQMPVSIYNYYLNSSFLYPEKNNFLYIHRKGLGFFVDYRYILLNKQGHTLMDSSVIRTDTTIGLKAIKYISSKDISDTSTMVLKHYIKPSFHEIKSPFAVKYEIVDRHGNFSDVVDISTSLEPAYQFNLDFVNDDYFIVSARDSIFQNGSLYLQKRYYMFSSKGKLLEKVSFDNKTNELYFDISKPIVIQKKMFFGVFRDIGGIQNLFFLKSNGFGILDTLKVLKVKTEKDKIGISEMYVIGTDKLLIIFRHRDIDLTRESYNSVLMVFENKTIGINTSTKDISKNRKRYNLKLYPNPTTGILNIDLEESIQGKIVIYDVLGKKVMEESIFGNKKNMDVSTLATGTYNISIESKGKKIGNEQFVKE